MRWFKLDWLNATQVAQTIYRLTGDPGMALAVSQKSSVNDYNFPFKAPELYSPPPANPTLDLVAISSASSSDSLFTSSTSPTIEVVISNNTTDIIEDAMDNATGLELNLTSPDAETTSNSTNGTLGFATTPSLNLTSHDAETTYNSTNGTLGFATTPSFNIITPFKAVAESLRKVRDFYTIEQDSYLRWIPIQLLITCSYFFLRRCFRLQSLARHALNIMVAALMLVTTALGSLRYGIEMNKRDMFMAVCCSLLAHAFVEPDIRAMIVIGILGVVAVPFRLLHNFVSLPICHFILRHSRAICMTFLVVTTYVYLWPIAYPEDFEEGGDVMIGKEICSQLYHISRIPTIWAFLHAWFASATERLSLHATPHVKLWSDVFVAFAAWLNPLIGRFLKPLQRALTDPMGTWNASQAYATEPLIVRIGDWIATQADYFAQSLSRSCGARCEWIHKLDLISMTADGINNALLYVPGTITQCFGQVRFYVWRALTFLWIVAPHPLNVAEELLIALGHLICAWHCGVGSFWFYITASAQQQRVGNFCIWLLERGLDLIQFIIVYIYWILSWIIYLVLFKISGKPQPLRSIKQFLESCSPYNGRFDQKAVDLYLVLGHVVYWRTADSWGRKSPYGSQLLHLFSGKMDTPRFTFKNQVVKENQGRACSVLKPFRNRSAPVRKLKVVTKPASPAALAAPRLRPGYMRPGYLRPALKPTRTIVVSQPEDKLLPDSQTTTKGQDLIISHLKDVPDSISLASSPGINEHVCQFTSPTPPPVEWFSSPTDPPAQPDNLIGHENHDDAGSDKGVVSPSPFDTSFKFTKADTPPPEWFLPAGSPPTPPDSLIAFNNHDDAGAMITEPEQTQTQRVAVEEIREIQAAGTKFHESQLIDIEMEMDIDERQENFNNDSQINLVPSNQGQESHGSSFVIPTGKSFAIPSHPEQLAPLNPFGESQYQGSTGTAQSNQGISNFAALSASFGGHNPVLQTSFAEPFNEFQFQTNPTGLFGASARPVVQTSTLFTAPVVRPPSVNFFSGGQQQLDTNEILGGNNLSELLSTGFAAEGDDIVAQALPVATPHMGTQPQGFPENAPTHAPDVPKEVNEVDDPLELAMLEEMKAMGMI